MVDHQRGVGLEKHILWSGSTMLLGVGLIVSAAPGGQLQAIGGPIAFFGAAAELLLLWLHLRRSGLPNDRVR